jgi:two-component system response regulator (stage 0 sporulation protein F)
MSRMRVLLVDDEESFIKTLSERLQMRDLQTNTAFNGEAAIEFVQDKEPDVMVLDLKMPGIDGMEVLRRVKKRFPGIQVIILTGHGSDLQENETRRLGVFDYLNKPVEIEVLIGRIKAAYQAKLRGSMSAAAFAEAGEPDMARQLLRDDVK